MFSKAQILSVFQSLSPTPVGDLPVSDSFSLLAQFYETQRPTDAVENQDGDMLLFQWGTYDWGDGANFTLNLTRQLIYPDGEFDQEIWQMGLTYNYEPSAALDALKSGHRWCHDLSNVKEFMESVLGSEAVSACGNETPRFVKLTWENQ